MRLTAAMSRRTTIFNTFTNSGTGEEVGLQLDRRKGFIVCDIITTFDRRTGVCERNDRRREEKSGPGDEIFSDIDVTDHKISGGTIEYTPHLPGDAWTKELSHVPCALGPIFKRFGHATRYIWRN